MKHLLFIIACLYCYSGYGQVVAIQNDRTNVVYTGIENPLTIAASGVSQGELIVTATKGKIDGEKGRYSLKVDSVGTMEVVVWKKAGTGKKKIGMGLFRVKRLPDPVAYLGRTHINTLSQSYARLLIAPSATFVDLELCASFRIYSVTVIVLRDGKLLLMKGLRNEHGIRFSDDTEVQTVISQLAAGDRLMICDILCKMPDGSDRHLHAIEYTITERE